MKLVAWLHDYEWYVFAFCEQFLIDGLKILYFC